MKITKFGHSCLMAEMPAPVNRTVLFDPGGFSQVPVETLEYLDDIFITHNHFDHCDPELIQKLVTKFPDVRITATAETVAQLAGTGIQAHETAPEGVQFFESPHADGGPLMSVVPSQVGFHYLDMLSHPGDSHNFTETKPILALPVVAPWGSTANAVRVALELKPKYVIPVHDWFWHEAARNWSYDAIGGVLEGEGITLLRPNNGEPFVIDLNK